MTDAIVSRLGQTNQTGGSYANDTALFLKVFGGEVLAAFDETNVMMDKHTIRNISSGKSASFPVTGKFSAGYHTPGQELLGSKLNHAERVIAIDDLLVADTFIANIDEAMNHWDVRSTYSKELGRALARTLDKHLLQMGVLAARASAAVSDGYAGDVIGENTSGAPASADFEDNGEHLAEAIYLAGQKLDEKDIPQEDRYVFVRPKQYNKLVTASGSGNNKVNINRDWGGAGSYADGTILKIDNMTIVKTNHLPSTNITTGVLAGPDQGSGAKYAGDFSNCVALVMHPAAIGTVKLLDLAMESEYQISRQGTLMVAKYAMGHGILRQDASVEIRAANV